MATTIEITASAIRVCRENHDQIVALESFPVPAGVEPLAALAQAPLPPGLGKVTVVMQHPDMLMRTMLQPPCPPERLARIVRFELQGLSKEESEPTTMAWHVVRAMGGSGDMRILTTITKRGLITQLNQALATHGGKLGALVHPAIGLFHAFKRQDPAYREDAILADVGGKNLHLALIRDGELLFLRSQAPAMDDLITAVAELRSIARPEAERLIAKLGKGAPDDLHDLIRRQVQALAGLISNNVRFAKAQLHLEAFEPKAIYIAGSGGQVFGFNEALAERMHASVRLLNPFAGVIAKMDTEQLDRLSILPSPWVPCIGTALANEWELDSLSEDKQRRLNFWRTDGAIRAACAAVLALFILAFVRQSLAAMSVGAVIERLQGDDEKEGLVPKAQKVHAELDKLRDQKQADGAKIAFLDGERRAGRVAVELLSAISEQQDPTTCPVVLQKYKVVRKANHVLAEIEGFAESAVKRSTAEVLRTFEQQLARRYQPITFIQSLPKPTAKDHQEFEYQIGIGDLPLEVVSQANYANGNRKGLAMTVKWDGAGDLEAVAMAVVDRYLASEDELKVKIVPRDASTSPVEMLWDEKRHSLERSGR